MARYRRKPTLVEAMQWTGDNGAEIREWMGGDGQLGDVAASTAMLYVAANRGWLPIQAGEWVLRDSAGFYPCKDDIFRETYEAVEPEPEAHVIALGDEFGGLTVTLQAVDDVGHWQAIVHDGDKALFGHVFDEEAVRVDVFNESMGVDLFERRSPVYRGVSLYSAMCEAVRVHHDTQRCDE